MKYNLINKVRDDIQERDMTHEQVMNLVAGFFVFNKPRKPLLTDADKIASYNRRSFYKVVVA